MTHISSFGFRAVCWRRQFYVIKIESDNFLLEWPNHKPLVSRTRHNPNFGSPTSDPQLLVQVMFRDVHITPGRTYIVNINIKAGYGALNCTQKFCFYNFLNFGWFDMYDRVGIKHLKYYIILKYLSSNIFERFYIIGLVKLSWVDLNNESMKFPWNYRMWDYSKNKQLQAVTSSYSSVITCIRHVNLKIRYFEFYER